MNSWRKPRPHKPDPNAPKVPVPATKFFDNLSFIGNSDVGCFLLETSEGLIMFDNMFPQYAEYIEQGIRDLGHDPADLKIIMITHGHGDHYGNSVYFREKYGTKLMMSEIDEAFAHTPESSPRGEIMPFDVDGYLTDGGSVTLGDTTVETFHTPGHTPGCMSFVFDVYDEGRHHKASLWGGTGVPRAMEARETLLNSCLHFAEIGLEKGCDVAISTHPFVDNTVDRLQTVRDIVDGVANPFVLGYEGYHRFEQMYIDMYRKSLEK